MTNSPAKTRPCIRRRAAVLAALACGIVAYCNSFHGPFIFDDIESVLDNPQVNRALAHDAVVPSSTLTGRPLLLLTMQANYAIGGLNVVGYHVVNLLIHLGCGALLFGIVRRNLSRREFWGDRFADSADWLAGAVAAVWLVHPLNTEAVAYITQRAESLASLFFLAVIYCLIRAADGRAPVRWSMAAVVACAVGMATKETMVTAPIIALFYDRTFLAGSFGAALRKRSRLYLGLAATWIVLAILLTGRAREASVQYTSGLSAWDEIRTQPGVIAHYFRLALWPQRLVLDYYDWPIAHQWTHMKLGGYLVFALLICSVIAFWKKPWLGFLGAWFFVILSPSSSVVPLFTEVAAEHRMYLPLAAPVALVVAGCWVANRIVAVALVACLIVSLTTLTLLRNAQYQNPVEMWRYTVAERPMNPRAYYNLGYSLQHSGRSGEAVAPYREALLLEPDYYAAAKALGLALIASGDHGGAEEYYTEEMKIMPQFAPEALLQRSQLRRKRGDIVGADTDFQAAARLELRD
jgi:tetratricopeptide (TPR) repeat protein